MSVSSILKTKLQRSDVSFLIKQGLDSLPALIQPQDREKQSWSQHGEDLVLSHLLKDFLTTGFYVDVGANHPTKLSNTFKLYRLGMRGLIVEPNTPLFWLHRKVRPQDMHLCAGVGEKDGIAPYYQISSHVLSTFSKHECQQALDEGHSLVSTSLIPMFTLETILQSCQLTGRSIFALLSIDTEGLDSVVLRSNDWSAFRPRCIVVENKSRSSGIAEHLTGLGYNLHARLGVNQIFVRQEQ